MSLRRSHFLICFFLASCAPAEPPKTAPVPTEADARSALEAAKQKDDGDALIAVYNQYPKFESGKKALRLGVRKLLEKAIDSAEKCDEPAAAGAVAHVAPYTADDQEIDEAYDETKTKLSSEHKRCQLVKLDADVKKAEAAFDWPAAFKRIQGEKEADGAALKQRRVQVTEHWRTWIDDSIKQVIAKKGFEAALGDKRDAFDAAIDPGQLPSDLGVDLDKRSAAIKGLKLVFDQLEDGELVDPPVKHWTFGAAKSRKVDLSDGAVLPQGIEFFAVAKGKAKGVTLLAAGSAEGDLYTRLASIKLFVPESDARTWDTRMSLPEKLVGARVLAPMAPNSDQLVVATVLAEQPNGAIVLQPVGKKTKLAAKKKDLRGLYLNVGQKVTVIIGGTAKPGEIADTPDDERVLVRVAGFESFYPLSEVRVRRADLPPLPAE